MDALTLRRRAAVVFLSLVAAACGGGGGGSAEPQRVAAPDVPVVTVEKPATRAEAARFLAQATFGPTDAEIDRVMALGYAAWIDEQLAKPASQHRALWEAADRSIKSADPTRSAGANEVLNSFWRNAVTGVDQLRLRVAFALSQIFVISLADGAVDDDPRAVAAWMDLLATEGLGRYRTLLESVTRHPMMGLYLSHLRNQKADPKTGRVPDENYAREVMQLFSIGLVELNEDGSARLAGGQPVETYGPADIGGLAKVFTGFSWACPAWPDNGCFLRGSVNGAADPDRGFKPMLAYAQYHSTEEKRFLGTVIPPQATADPNASLTAALDTIAAHPNVGPFIGRQLIQRLVTSNPSPEYVRAVARAFADNGAGVRGDLKAVVKSVLMHPEARRTSDTGGKLREPVLRLAALLRAFPHRSASGQWRVGNTDNPGTSLGQSPLRAPSVFNFYRPGYVPPGTQVAASGLVAPEMQIAHETSAAGYVNFMRDAVSLGTGAFDSALGRRDIQPDFAPELALADRPAELVERVAEKLTYGAAGSALRSEIADAVSRIAVPALNSAGTNQAQIDTARRNRVNAALLLVLASPEFQVLR